MFHELEIPHVAILNITAITRENHGPLGTKTPASELTSAFPEATDVTLGAATAHGQGWSAVLSSSLNMLPVPGVQIVHRLLHVEGHSSVTRGQQ